MEGEDRVTRDDIPDVKAIKQAVLNVLSSGRQRSFESLEREAAKTLGLTSQQERYCTSGSGTPLFANRVEKARVELRKEGLVEYPGAGKVKLTEAGKARVENTGVDQVPPPPLDAEGPAVEPSRYEPTLTVTFDEEKTAKSFEGGVVVFPEPDKTAKAPSLSLILAVIGLLLCLTGVLAFAGVLCGIASLALLYLGKKRAGGDVPPVHPKATLAVAACAVVLGLVMSVGAAAGGTQAPPQEADPPQAQQQEPEEAGELSFLVNGSGDALPASVTVLVTGTQEDGARVEDKHEAALGKSYVLGYPAGTYTFKIDPSSLTVGETVYASDEVECTFDGAKDKAVRLVMKLDEETLAKIEAEKEAERLKAEEEAAAQKAAEEEAAAQKAAEEEAAAAAAAEQEAAAAAAAAVANGGGGGGGDDVTVYITKTGEKFHRDGCQYLKKSQIPISRSNAIAQGYGACSRCNP